MKAIQKEVTADEEQTPAIFHVALMTSLNIDISLLKLNEKSRLSSLAAELPNFPWLIAYRRVLVSEDLKSRFEVRIN